MEAKKFKKCALFFEHPVYPDLVYNGCQKQSSSLFGKNPMNKFTFENWKLCLCNVPFNKEYLSNIKWV